MTTTAAPSHHARRGTALGVVYLVLLVGLLFDPTGETSGGGTNLLIRTARDLHLSPWLIAHVEFLANIAIFAPLPVIGALILGRRSVATWTGWIFIVSLTVETFQLVVLGGTRVASTADVVANTVGGLLGASLVAGVGVARVVLARRRAD